MARKPKAARQDSLRQLQAKIEDLEKEIEDVGKEFVVVPDSLNKWIASLMSNSKNAAQRLIDSHIAASGKPLSLKDIQVSNLASKQPTAVFSAVVLLDANNLAQMLLKVHQVDAAMAQYFFAGFLAVRSFGIVSRR